MTFTTPTGNGTSITFRTAIDTGTAQSDPSPDDTDKAPAGITTAGSGDWLQLAGLSPTGNPGTNTGVITITNFKLPASVTRITLETSG